MAVGTGPAKATGPRIEYLAGALASAPQGVMAPWGFTADPLGPALSDPFHKDRTVLCVLPPVHTGPLHRLPSRTSDTSDNAAAPQFTNRESTAHARKVWLKSRAPQNRRVTQIRYVKYTIPLYLALLYMPYPHYALKPG
jgi:hypothetical protein